MATTDEDNNPRTRMRRLRGAFSGGGAGQSTELRSLRGTSAEEDSVDGAVDPDTLRRQILRETGEIEFTTSTRGLPEDEYHEQVQDWNP